MIVFLNGPSSSGKTTLSRNLQKIWPRPLYYLSYDSVDEHIAPFRHAQRPFSDPEKPGEALDEVRDFLTVMTLTAAAIDRSGRDAVTDNCLFDTEDLYAETLRLTASCDTFWMRIDIDPDELSRRERERGDRTIGKAAWQRAHLTPKEDAAYDLILDGAAPSEENARRILEAVRKRTSERGITDGDEERHGGGCPARG
ncbi:MAG: AAA family ATPase [Clostridia bacterium]|nr:AAA family ATPase [Clostridia bacterium]